jgi:NADH-quinone oxidoreductase subunit C
MSNPADANGIIPTLFPAQPVTAEAMGELIKATLGDKLQSLVLDRGETTVTVSAAGYFDACKLLRDTPGLQFEQLIDICGVDYSAYKDGAGSAYSEGPRFAAVSHLLSVSCNQRVRVRVFCPDDDLPVVASITPLWTGANWFEREAFDLYGIVFEGHDDLRRILTDYGFIGHPFRKDFPTNGHVEMRYDAEQKRVVYQPVTIELREITPRIIREDNYGGLH